MAIQPIPYTHLLQGRDAAAVMRETPARLTAELARFTPAEIDRPTAPGKWSLREILCHLADCEVAWAWRLRQVYGTLPHEPVPVLQPFEQDPWARAYAGTGYTAAQALTSWQAMRIWNLLLIDTFTDNDKRKPVHHPEAGDLTLWTLVEIAAGHDLHHLNRLQSITPITS